MMTKDEQALFDVEALKQKISNTEAALRGLQLDVTAAKIADDEDMKKRATELIAKQVKVKDAYEQMLAGLKKGDS